MRYGQLAPSATSEVKKVGVVFKLEDSVDDQSSAQESQFSAKSELNVEGLNPSTKPGLSSPGCCHHTKGAVHGRGWIGTRGKKNGTKSFHNIFSQSTNSSGDFQ